MNLEQKITFNLAKRQMRVFALERSGSHAITDWILSQCEGKTVFINNVKPDLDGSNLEGNPFKSYKQVRCDNVSQEDLKEDYENRSGELDNLMYSYYDLDISQINERSLNGYEDIYFGDFLVKFSILILRDPFNYFASKLKAMSIPNQRAKRAFKIPLTPDSKGYLQELWKDYAREYLDGNHMNISYNKWFSDESYRKDLSEKLFLEYNEDSLDEVSKYWRGSSFDKMEYDGKASDMDVLNRYTHYLDNHFYMSIFEDKEILDLSEEIFGEIPKDLKDKL